MKKIYTLYFENNFKELFDLYFINNPKLIDKKSLFLIKINTIWKYDPILVKCLTCKPIFFISLSNSIIQNFSLNFTNEIKIKMFEKLKIKFTGSFLKSYVNLEKLKFSEINTMVTLRCFLREIQRKTLKSNYIVLYDQNKNRFYLKKNIYSSFETKYYRSLLKNSSLRIEYGLSIFFFNFIISANDLNSKKNFHILADDSTFDESCIHHYAKVTGILCPLNSLKYQTIKNNFFFFLKAESLVVITKNNYNYSFRNSYFFYKFSTLAKSFEKLSSFFYPYNLFSRLYKKIILLSSIGTKIFSYDTNSYEQRCLKLFFNCASYETKKQLLRIYTNLTSNVIYICEIQSFFFSELKNSVNKFNVHNNDKKILGRDEIIVIELQNKKKYIQYLALKNLLFKISKKLFKVSNLRNHNFFTEIVAVKLLNNKSYNLDSYIDIKESENVDDIEKMFDFSIILDENLIDIKDYINQKKCSLGAKRNNNLNFFSNTNKEITYMKKNIITKNFISFYINYVRIQDDPFFLEDTSILICDFYITLKRLVLIRTRSRKSNFDSLMRLIISYVKSKLKKFVSKEDFYESMTIVKQLYLEGECEFHKYVKLKNGYGRDPGLTYLTKKLWEVVGIKEKISEAYGYHIQMKSVFMAKWFEGMKSIMYKKISYLDRAFELRCNNKAKMIAP
ncbi:hypothetical protein [Guillardia theta]|uniref:Uncharacterized protein n=2 Tax=Guillardia theta TaxID=55529 RepID=Q9XG31_GUITH|nr:hypothetical protein GTHECHR2131 [Guillardia theta]CAB40396.1 hypothetical protein [Guillardia theta]